MNQNTRRLNILYLHTHDAGRYVQPYGYAIPAPNVQKLAERGVLFRQAFNVAPTCSPSRSGLVTGRWPHCNGMFGLTGQG
jgi:arylsulfatase A-like enzyme